MLGLKISMVIVDIDNPQKGQSKFDLYTIDKFCNHFGIRDFNLLIHELLHSNKRTQVIAKARKVVDGYLKMRKDGLEYSPLFRSHNYRVAVRNFLKGFSAVVAWKENGLLWEDEATATDLIKDTMALFNKNDDGLAYYVTALILHPNCEIDIIKRIINGLIEHISNTDQLDFNDVGI